MNILSYNIRGLGRGLKWASIRNLVGKFNIDLLCLQETKKDVLDKASCQFLWGQSDLDWEWQPALNAAGGLLCIWDNNKFQVDLRISDKDFIMLCGIWLPQMQRVAVINIYAPCDHAEKRQLWQNLSSRKLQFQDSCWCLVGDFNCIRHPLERQGSNNTTSDSQIIQDFNEWLVDMEVEEVPCLGKPFTWVRPNGTCKSKLDRVLVSDGWLELWPDTSQHNLERNYSDHCPVILKSKISNWGPKPFKVFDGWLQIKEYNQVVKDCWSVYRPMGWGGLVLKNKLKNLKQRLKLWSKENSADICTQIKQLQQHMNELENSMPSQPSEQQIKQLREVQSKLWEKANLHESILRQKARSRWVKEGDSSSSYFHKLINYSRRRNAIRGLLIDGSWVEDPLLVKAEVLQHFQNRFHEPQLQRPNLDGVHFSVLSAFQKDSMVEPFKEEEVRCAVWSCGNDKSLGPDGFNFKFIKHFWKELKPEFLRFISEFYVNASFPKGSNSSFIALIPKIKDPQVISDSRPISLIGCIYKVITKWLANRMRKIMPQLIDERQSTRETAVTWSLGG